MHSGHFVSVLRFIRRLTDGEEAGQSSDRQLLHCFLAHRDEQAFAAIIERHRDLVWGVCRRVLDDPNDADDVFQACFLVLLNKAESLRERASLAGWLQGVAWRLARKVKAQAGRRKIKEARAIAPAGTSGRDDILWSDMRSVLDEELEALPEKYREPLILCYLEGKTYSEAANQLGWSDGTVCGRLARARELLKRRLTRRGIALGAATLTATSIEPASAPAAVVASVAGMTRAFLLSQSMGNTASTTAVVLARGLLQTMALSKLKLAAMGIGLLCVCAASASWVTQQIGRTQVIPGETQPAELRNAQILPSPDPAAVSTNQGVPDAVPTLQKDFYGDPLPPGALARMGSTQFRHALADLAFAGDGKSLISAGADHSIIQWELSSGKVLRRSLLPLEKQAARCLSPDGKTMAAGDKDSIQLYDVVTGMVTRRLEFPGGSGNALAFSGNGKYLACASSASPECVIRIWDLTTGNEHLSLTANLPSGVAVILEPAGGGVQKRQVNLNPNQNVRTVFFSADGSVIGLRYGQKIMLWDTASGRVLGKNINSFDGFALSPDGKILAQGHATGAVILTQIPALTRLAVLEPQPPLSPSAAKPKLAFSLDGTFLAVGGLERLLIWDLNDRKEVTRLVEGDSQQVIFSPDGKTLAAAGKSMIRLWDVPTWKELHGRANHDGRIGHISISPDGTQVASSETFKPNVEMWDAKSGRPLRTFTTEAAGYRSCSFTSDGRLLVTGSPGGILELLDPTTGKTLHNFVETDEVTGRSAWQILHSHLSTDGKRLAILTRAYDSNKQEQRHQLSVFDVEFGNLLVRRPFPGTGFSTLGAFTPSGLRMAVCYDGRMSIQETMTGTERLVVRGDVGYPIQFSPSGDLAVIGIQKTEIKSGPDQRTTWEELGLRVIEVATGEELFRVDGRVRIAAFSRDSRKLATATFEGLQLRDASTGTELFHLRWPKEFVPEDPRLGVTSLALMPDGQAAAVGMPDGTILVWDLRGAAKPISLPGNKTLERANMNDFWANLLGEAKKAQTSVHALNATPDQTVPYLASRLGPVKVADRAKTAKLIAALDDKDAGVRDASARALAEVGQQIGPDLQRTLDANPSMEARTRIGAIRESWKSGPVGETRRTARAIQTLRMIGSPPAVELLRRLAGGAPGARETQLARDALDDLKIGK